MEKNTRETKILYKYTKKNPTTISTHFKNENKQNKQNLDRTEVANNSALHELMLHHHCTGGMI